MIFEAILITLTYVFMGACVFGLLMFPFVVGIEREPYKPKDAVVFAIQAILIIAMGGRIVGWW